MKQTKHKIDGQNHIVDNRNAVMAND